MSESSTKNQDDISGGHTISRRAAMTAGTLALASPLAARAAADEDAIATLVRLAADKNAAFMRGDMELWARLTPIANDFTLMQPFGGPVSCGFDKSPARLAELSRYFRNGRAQLELVRTYGSDDIVVLVMVERQRGEVGGLPDQDWSLRVTEIYRRRGTEWQLTHRHADPLTRSISLEQAAALARGQYLMPY
jgi:ketosteroid isomerase-like protein